jgi:hypothetical protein
VDGNEGTRCDFFANKIKSNVFCAASDDADLFEEDEGRSIYKSVPLNLDSGQLQSMTVTRGSRVILDMVRDAWGENLAFSIQHIDVVDGTLHIPAPARLVLTVASVD